MGVGLGIRRGERGLNAMDEKSRMLAGALYRATDAVLVAERKRAKALCREYNASETLPNAAILRALFGRPTDAYIEPPFFCDYGYNIRLGARFYANHGLIVLDVMPVTIGDDVFVAPNVVISAATHPADVATRISGLELGKPVTIGSGVWIGSGVQVLPGVSIGDGTTIGAGSVVTRDIPAHCVAAGNPCRVLRHLGVD
jgi:maltose O-acetyltransferase